MSSPNLNHLLGDPFFRAVAQAVTDDLYRLASMVNPGTDEQDILLDAADSLADALEATL